MDTRAAANLRSSCHDLICQGVLDQGDMSDAASAQALVKIAEKVHKLTNNQVTIHEASAVVWRVLFRSLARFEADHASGPIVDAIGAERAKEIADEIADIYVSIPRKYKVYIPLPGLSFPAGVIEIAPHTSFVSGNNVAPQKRAVRAPQEPAPSEAPQVIGDLGSAVRLVRPGGKSSGTFLLLEVEGFIDGYCGFECATAMRAASMFKIYFQQMMFKRIIELERSRWRSLLGKAPITHLSMVAVCDSDPGSIEEVEIPLGFSHVVSSARLCSSNDQFNDAVEKSGLSVVLSARLQETARLIESEKKSAASIRSAIEAHFDSYRADGTTAAFVQVCIGLEALFCEGVKDGITRTLADRCAYLIGSSLDGRDTIRSRMGKIYELRSKIFHGEKSSLTLDEHKELAWARTTLEFSIAKEIKYSGLR